MQFGDVASAMLVNFWFCCLKVFYVGTKAVPIKKVLKVAKRAATLLVAPGIAGIECYRQAPRHVLKKCQHPTSGSHSGGG